jgi:hypothetical protein
LQGAVIGGENGFLVIFPVRIDENISVMNHLWFGNDGDVALVLLGKEVHYSFDTQGQDSQSIQLLNNMSNFITNHCLYSNRELLSDFRLQNTTSINRKKWNNIRIYLGYNKSVDIEKLAHSLHGKVSSD